MRAAAARFAGRSVPLGVADTGFRRLPLGVADSERFKSRVRAAAEAIGHLNRSGLYGERPLLGIGR